MKYSHSVEVNVRKSSITIINDSDGVTKPVLLTAEVLVSDSGGLRIKTSYGDPEGYIDNDYVKDESLLKTRLLDLVFSMKSDLDDAILEWAEEVR